MTKGKTLDERIVEGGIYGANIVLPFSKLKVGEPIGGLIFGGLRLAERLGKLDRINPALRDPVRLGLDIARFLGTIVYAVSTVNNLYHAVTTMNGRYLGEAVMSAAMTYELGKEAYESIRK